MLDAVQTIVLEDERETPFVNGRPGRTWLAAFYKRHPQLTKRTPESVTKNRENVSEESFRNWFSEVHEYLTEREIACILKDPKRLLNGDESGFKLCQKKKTVIAIKGSRDVIDVLPVSEKDQVTAMFTGAADGTLLPGMVVYPYKRIPEAVAQNHPEGWFMGRSDSGWMTGPVFYEYIAKCIIPWLKKNGRLPAIMFFDSHKSHLTYELFKLCEQEGLHLITLLENASHIHQVCYTL